MWTSFYFAGMWKYTGEKLNKEMVYFIFIWWSQRLKHKYKWIFKFENIFSFFLVWYNKIADKEPSEF